MNLEKKPMSQKNAIKLKVKKLIREVGEDATKFLFRSYDFREDFFFDFDVEDNYDKISSLNHLLLQEQVLNGDNSNVHQQLINKYLQERKFNDAFDLVESDYTFQYMLLCNLINNIDKKQENIKEEKQDLLQDMQNYVENEKKEKNKKGKILYFHTA